MILVVSFAIGPSYVEELWGLKNSFKRHNEGHHHMFSAESARMGEDVSLVGSLVGQNEFEIGIP